VWMNGESHNAQHQIDVSHFTRLQMACVAYSSFETRY